MLKKVPPECTTILLPQSPFIGCKLFSAAKLTVVICVELRVHSQFFMDELYVRYPSRTTLPDDAEVLWHKDATVREKIMVSFNNFISDIIMI